MGRIWTISCDGCDLTLALAQMVPLVLDADGTVRLLTPGDSQSIAGHLSHLACPSCLTPQPLFHPVPAGTDTIHEARARTLRDFLSASEDPRAPRLAAKLDAIIDSRGWETPEYHELLDRLLELLDQASDGPAPERPRCDRCDVALSSFDELAAAYLSVMHTTTERSLGVIAGKPGVACPRCGGLLACTLEDTD